MTCLCGHAREDHEPNFTMPPCKVCRCASFTLKSEDADLLDKRGDYREISPSGAVRDSQEGKGRYDLISPIALRELALVCERGAIHYAPRNWEKGMPVSRFISSALRHLQQALERREDEPHLAHAMWNCMAAIHTVEMIARKRLPAELDDRPDFKPA